MGPRTVNVEPIHWPNTRPRDEEIAEMVEWFKQRKRRLSRRANTRATPTTAPIILETAVEGWPHLDFKAGFQPIGVAIWRYAGAMRRGGARSWRPLSHHRMA